MKHTKYNFWVLWIFLLVIVLSSCSPEKRLASLLKRHPELVRVDTIFRHDTILVNGSSTDTIFKTQVTKDTIIIRENNLTVKYYNDGKHTYIKGVCDTIRIIREIPIQVNQVEAKPIGWWERAWQGTKDFLIVLLLGAILVLIYLQRKSFK